MTEQKAITQPKLTHYTKITGRFKLKSGLHIGGSSEKIEIGGLENAVLRHPLTGAPYIPGSSIKGRVRSLLELKQGRFVFVNNQRIEKGQQKDKNGKPIDDDGEPCQCGRPECLVCVCFGPHKNTDHRLGLSRTLFRDARLTTKSRDELEKAIKTKGVDYTEVKTENMVKRTSGAAEHPRPIERVYEGVEFGFEISLRIFKDDDEAKLVNFVKEGLSLLESDALGGSGSRGSGWVQVIYGDPETD